LWHVAIVRQIEDSSVTTNANGTDVRLSSHNDQERNKQLVRRLFDAMVRGATDEMQALWTSDAANHASGRPGLRLPAGGEGIVMVARMLRSAFPDRHWQIDEMIAEGDLVACRMTVSGTFGNRPERPPFGMPPDQPGVEGTDLLGAFASGKPYSVKHMHMFRIAHGKIAEHWAARDDLGLLLQLGAISVSERAATPD
jgi:predicted ester cyclase